MFLWNQEPEIIDVFSKAWHYLKKDGKDFPYAYFYGKTSEEPYGFALKSKQNGTPEIRIIILKTGDARIKAAHKELKADFSSPKTLARQISSLL